VLTGLWATLAFPVVTAWPVHVAVFLVISFALVLGLATVAAATARLKLLQTARVYWSWGLGIGLLAMVVAMIAP